MINILFISLAALAVLSALVVPYIPSGLYSLYSILQPKYIWQWTFPNIQFSYICAVSLIIGFLFKNLFKKIEYKIIINKESFFILSILILTYTSEAFSPFTIYKSMVSGNIVIDSLTVIVILYFFQLLIIVNSKDNIKALKFHYLIFLFCIVYYVYWSNDRFLSGNWEYFRNGRLTGPSSGPYFDENALSVLVVMGMPFVLNLIFFSSRKIVIIISFFILIFLWHSIFLFGSRGALIATLVCLVTSFILINKNKAHRFSSSNFQLKTSRLKKIIFLIFVAALTTQASTVLKRSNEIVVNAKNDEQVPLNPRILSWTVGTKLALDFPLLGVGPQRFQHATHIFYPGETIHVAHNTYIAFAANMGIPCSLFFIFLLLSNLKSRNRCNKVNIYNHNFLNYLNESIHVCLIGFVICSLFLDLIIFEPIFFVFMINKCKEILALKLHGGNSE